MQVAGIRQVSGWEGGGAGVRGEGRWGRGERGGGAGVRGAVGQG